MPRKSRTRGSATVIRRSRNSYMRCPRSVTIQRIGMRDVGNMNGQFLLHDTSRIPHARPGMAFSEVDPLHDGAQLGRKYAQHLARLSLVAAGGDDHVVALLDF